MRSSYSAVLVCFVLLKLTKFLLVPSVEAECKSFSHLPLQNDLLGSRGGAEATGIKTPHVNGQKTGKPWRNDIEGQESPIITFSKVFHVVTNLLCAMPSVYSILGNAKKRCCISRLGIENILKSLRPVQDLGFRTIIRPI